MEILNDSPGEPSSSTPRSQSKQKKSRKEKQSAPEADAALTNAVQNAEASSSKQAIVAVAPTVNGDSEANAHRKEKRRRNKEKRLQQDGPNDDRGGAQETEWVGIPLAQTQVSGVPPIWSSDGRFYIAVQGASVHINSSTAPYDRLSTLNAVKSSSQPITALQLSPLDSNHLVTASQEGKVRVWNYVSGKLIHTIHLDGPCHQMCLGEVGGSWQVFVTVSTNKSSKKKHKDNSASYRVMRFAFPTETSSAPSIHFLGKLSSPPTALFISPTSTYLAALAGNKVYTFLLPTLHTTPDWSAQLVKFVSDQPLTCGSFAPVDKLSKHKEEWFATGDQRGNIRLWHGLGQAFRYLGGGSSANARDAGKVMPDAEKRLPTTSLHWHAHAVAALAFTPSGSQLLSVGEESVLVQWHLGSGKREYVPRLGGRPIVSLAVKGGSRGKEEEWWMAFKDGSVVKVGSASGQIETVGSGVKIDPLRSVNPATPYPLALHPSTSSLVLPSSHPGTLQFIDPAQSTVIMDLEVAPSNRVSRRDDQELTPVAVEKVAFSEAVDGRSEWMATVEGRKGDEWEGGGEVRNMKLWRWDGERYVVNTQFPRPHGLWPLSALVFTSPSDSSKQPLLLTTAVDGSCKLWQVRQSKKSEHGKNASKRPAVYESYWSLRSSWSYRSLPIHSAAFSPDSTLIALAHGTAISLWETESNLFMRAFDHALVTDLAQVVFAGLEGRYLVASGTAGMACWDLLSCQAVWTDMQAKRYQIARHTSGHLIAHHSVASNTIISVISASSPRPIREIQVKQPLHCLQVIPSSTNSHDSLSFVGISTSGEILRLGDRSSPKAAITSRLQPAATDKKSIWQEMFGEHAFLSPEQALLAEPTRLGLTVSGRKPTGRPAAIFDGPSHTLPPPSMLFDEFMHELLALPAAPAPPAAIQEDVVLFEEEVTVEDALPGRKIVGKVVKDEEVKELSSFFASLFSTPTTATTHPQTLPKQSTPRSLPNGTNPSTTAKSGHRLPNGTASSVKSGYTPSSVKRNGTAADASSSTSGSPVLAMKALVAAETPVKIVNGGMAASSDVERSLDGKKSKKRKAPRDSGV